MTKKGYFPKKFEIVKTMQLNVCNRGGDGKWCGNGDDGGGGDAGGSGDAAGGGGVGGGVGGGGGG